VHSLTLEALGFSEHFRTCFDHDYEPLGLRPSRVSTQHRGAYVLRDGAGEVWAQLGTGLRCAAGGPADLPAVGDWVAYAPAQGGGRALVHGVLPRRSAFVRRAAGERGDEQVVAANVDVLLLVFPLDRDLRVRLMERYLALAWESGAEPVIVLSKDDLCDDPRPFVLAIEAVSFGAPVHIVSSRTGSGLEALAAHLGPGRTAAAVGSSGVGKSTLINRLRGDDSLPTAGLRADGHGRHTTSRRELLALPGGGWIVDTPGMRELGMAGGSEGMDAAFNDLEAIAARCRFRDCRHEREPGCAVRRSIAAGELPRERLESYRKLAREHEWMERRRDGRARAEERKRLAAMNRALRARSRR
jgi:ribosome biogenesis GTPase